VRNMTIVLALIALMLAVAAYYQGGPARVLAGVGEAYQALRGAWLLIMLAFLFAGLMQELISDQMVGRYLGGESGWRGLILATLAGGLMPGGPYVYYPIAASLMVAGADIGAIIAFLAAKNICSITRLPVEGALMGPRLLLIRLSVTFFMPPLMGALANRFFPGAGRRIWEHARRVAGVPPVDEPGGAGQKGVAGQ